MFDLSFGEILLVLLVGAVFIGPKDLPVIVRTIARALQGLRDVTKEIKAAVDEVSREAGVADIKETLDAEMRLIKGDDGKFYESYQIPTVKNDDGK